MVENKKITKNSTTKKSTKTKAKNTSRNNKNSKSINSKKGIKKVDKKIIFASLSLLIIIGIISLTFTLNTKEKVVITLDNIEYTESDFNMYAYLIKADYFGINGTEISENTLNTQLSNDSNITIGEFIKEKAISKMKTTAAILRIANENNITLTDQDLEEIEAEKNEFIEKLGGNSEFKLMLKKNQTTTKAYMEVAKAEKLYSIILNTLYKKGMRNDLTEEELDTYAKSYKTDYVKIKQIILLKKDLETDKFLDETTLNQKETLAKQIAKLAHDGEDFDKLIEKYSESYNGEVKSEYYLKTSLIEELKDAINLLENGGISKVVSSDYAYHIVIREKLDNAKLEEYYNSKREQKLIDDITDSLNKIAIINGEYLEEISVK